MAFAARAATTPSLATLQAGILAEVGEAIAGAIARAGRGAVPPEEARAKARIALAAVDGLALHAVSSGSWDRTALTDALDRLIDMLLSR